MALVTCYDADGNPHEKEPVDARECVAHCGYSMTAPAVAADGAPSDEISDGTGEALPEVAKRAYARKAKPLDAEQANTAKTE